MKLTELEKQLAIDIGNRCKVYNFYVLETGEMFFDREAPQRLTINHLKCMLRKDFKDKCNIPKYRFEQLLDVSIQAMLIMTQNEIKKRLVKY